MRVKIQRVIYFLRFNFSPVKDLKNKLAFLMTFKYTCYQCFMKWHIFYQKKMLKKQCNMKININEKQQTWCFLYFFYCILYSQSLLCLHPLPTNVIISDSNFLPEAVQCKSCVQTNSIQVFEINLCFTHITAFYKMQF